MTWILFIGLIVFTIIGLMMAHTLDEISFELAGIRSRLECVAENILVSHMEKEE